jgi:hypothetical protein
VTAAMQPEELLPAARKVNSTEQGEVDIRAMTAALPFPRMRIDVTTGKYFLRVGPARLDVDPAEPRGWEWLGFEANHSCNHQRMADHHAWGPKWVDCVPVPTGVDVTTPGPMRSIGGERKGRPGTGPESVIIDGASVRPPGHAPDGSGYCARCDYDDHRCPGCGAPVRHGEPGCSDCLTSSSS